MNYYIQGNKDKASQIKAAFEKLGIDVLDFGFADKTVVYCSIGGTCVQSLPYSINLMHILYSHPDYQELELPVEPFFKVEDWIVKNDNGTVSQITKTINGKDEYGEYRAYEHTNGYFAACFENEYHLWSIADAKDGDILHHSCTASNGTFIFKGVDESGKIFCYCDYDSEDYFCLGENHHIPCYTDSKFLHPATKEQRELLFKKMKEAGYRWDVGKKELKKIHPHYDIANFKPFDKVLCRGHNCQAWRPSLYGCYDTSGKYPMFVCATGNYLQCIPFNDKTKHLLGTSDMCPKEYINW